MSDSSVYPLSTWHKYLSKWFATSWSILTASLRGHLAWRQQIGIVISVELLVAVS